MSTATLGKNTLSKRGLLWRIAPVAMIPCHTEPSTLHSAPRRRTVSYRVSAHFELGFRSSLCQRAGDDAAGDEPLVSLASGVGLSNFCDAEDAPRPAGWFHLGVSAQFPSCSSSARDR